MSILTLLFLIYINELQQVLSDMRPDSKLMILHRFNSHQKITGCEFFIYEDCSNIFDSFVINKLLVHILGIKYLNV